MASGNIIQGVRYKEVTLTYESPVTLSPNTSGRFYITDSTLYNSKLVGVEITGSNLGSDIVAINAIGLTKDPTIARICVPIYNNSSANRSVSSVTLRIYYI